MDAFGAVYRRGVTTYTHSEYFELLHDGGLVGCALAGGLVGLVGVRLLRCLVAETARGEQLAALGLLTALGAWLLVAAVSVSTRQVGGQSFLACIIAFCPRSVRKDAPAVKVRPGCTGEPGSSTGEVGESAGALTGVASRLSWRWVAVGSVAVYGLALALAMAAWRGEVLYSRGVLHVARGRLEVAADAFAGAVAWHPPKALAWYEWLKHHGRSGDYAAADAVAARLMAYSEGYRDFPVIYADILARQGRFAEAFDVLQPYAKIAPYDYLPALSLPLYAMGAGEVERMNAAIERLLDRVIDGLNFLEDRSHEAVTTVYDGEVGLKIVPDDGSPPIFIPRRAMAGKFLQDLPADLFEGRERLRVRINVFLSEELDAAYTVIRRNP